MLNFFIKFLTLIFTNVVHILCYQKFSEERLNINIKKILWLLLITFLLLLNNLYNKLSLKLLSAFILETSLFFFWFKKNEKSLKNLFKYSLLVCILSVFVELILTWITSFMFINVNELNNYTIPKISFTIILTCSLYYICLILSKFFTIKKIITYKLEYFLLLIVIFLNSLIFYYNNNYKNYNITLNVALASIIFSLFILTLKSLHKKTIYKVKAEHLDEKVEYYEQIAADYSELKHNLNDDFLAIRSVANKETKDIVDEKIKKYNKNYGWISSLDNVPKGLQGLIYMKLSDIKEHEICVEVENKVDEKIISKLPSKTYSELCDALGITINNAIEATSNCSEKVIYINLEEDKEFLRLKIINTFSGSLDLDEIGNRNYSTKKVKSGIGLEYLKKLKTIKIKKEIMNNLFIISILVPIN